MPLDFDIEFPTIVRMEKPTLPLAVALQASANPNAALPLRMGEWLSRAGGTLSRPGVGAGIEVGVGAAPLQTPTYPYWNWRGQMDVQYSLNGSVIIPSPQYEAWTRLWSFANIPTAYGDMLSIWQANVGTLWAGYCVPGRWVAGTVIGFAHGVLPAAAADLLYFRTNY